MAKFILMKDPEGAAGRVVEHSKKTITQYLMSSEVGFTTSEFSIYLNGDKLSFPEYNSESIVNDGSPELYKQLSESDTVVIVNNPQGSELLIYAIVAVVAAASVVLLTPATTPNAQGEESTSPNNTLRAQTNQARSYQAIPDIYGNIISYPDLSGEATEQFNQIPNRTQPEQIITQLMVIGVGSYSVNQVRSSDSPITSLGGTFTIHSPNANQETIVPLVLETFSINEVDGQSLEGVNLNPDLGTVNATGIPQTQAQFETVSQFDNTFTLSTEQDLTNLGSPVFNEATVSITGTLLSGGTATRSATVIITNLRFNQISGQFFYELSFLVSSGSMSEFSRVTAFDISSNFPSAVGPFNTPAEVDEIWIDFEMPRGLEEDASFEIVYIPVDDLGNFVGSESRRQVTFSDANTYNPQFFTEKITGLSRSVYAVQVRRTNDESTDASTPSSTTLRRIAGVRRVENKNFGDVTLIEVNIPNTTQATSLRENTVNADVTRMTIGYNRETSQIDRTLRPSRSGADAILHEWSESFNQSSELLDLDGLYEIYDGLSDARLGFFDYSFDDINIPLGERIKTIANASRIYAFQDGNVWRFKRDELQGMISTVITRRDIARDRDFSINIKSFVGDSKDSVQVEYVDPLTNKITYIQKRIQNGAIINGVGMNPLRVEMPFCKERINAENRANLEIRKILYLRTFVTDTLLAQGHAIELGQKILYERVLNKNISGGEVLSIDESTNQITVSEPVDFSQSGLMINFTDDVGDTSDSFAIQQIETTDPAVDTSRTFRVMTDLSSTGIYVADQVNQKRGSVYMIGTVSSLGKSEYIVQTKVPSSNGRRVQVELARSDDRVYEED